MLKIDHTFAARTEPMPASPHGLAAFNDVLRVFRVRRATVASVAVAALLAATVYCVTADRIFQASTALLLDFSQDDPLIKDKRTPDAQVETAAIESQVQLVTADTVLSKVTKRLNLAQDPEFVGDDRWPVTRFVRGLIDRFAGGDEPGKAPDLEREAAERLAASIKATRIGRTYLVKIDALSRSPEKAALIADALAQSFMDDQFDARLAAADRSSDWMRRRADELRDQSLQADRAVQNYTSRVDRERVELRSLETTAQTYRKLFETFLDQYTTTAQTRRFPISFARIVTPATPPKRKAFPRTTLIMAGALVGGIGFGWLLGFALENLNRTVRSQDDLEELLELPAIGALPRIARADRGIRGRAQKVAARLFRRRGGSSAGAAKLVGQADMLLQVVRLYPRSRFSQTIDQVRAMIALTDNLRDVKMIGVVSARRGEGKTIVAANLAQHLAMSGARTALLDWNFQSPSLTLATLGDNDQDGDGCRPVVDANSGLTFLPVPANQRGRSASAVLTTPAQEQLVDHLRGRFDYVCIDLPSIDTAMEVRALSALVDCCVLVCDAQQMKAEPLTRLLRLWRSVGPAVPILGFVLNRAPRTAPDTRGMGVHEHVERAGPVQAFRPGIAA